MHILLINANPVVSRLLVLCTRDDAVVLEEVSEVEDVQSDRYDIVFVDEASYGRDVADLLVKFGYAKKVFISYRSDAMRGFDITIKKPFLPSQITDIIKELEVSKVEPEIQEETVLIENDKSDEEIPHIFPLSSDDETEEEVEEIPEPSVLDGNEIEKIKALLEMDDEEVVTEVLSDDALEARKVELIKEQLIAEGLEIVEENQIVEELSIGLDGTLNKHSAAKAKTQKVKKPKVKKEKQKKKSKSKKIKFTEENMERIEDAVEMAMATMTKKQMKKLLKGKEIAVSIKLEDNNE
jgi:hypothetical protein